MYGDLCVDTIMDPACPALSRFNNTWLISTTKASLCNLGCLKALCQLTARSTLGSNGGRRHNMGSLLLNDTCRMPAVSVTPTCPRPLSALQHAAYLHKASSRYAPNPPPPPAPPPTFASTSLATPPGPACVDAELELYLRWDLMELMGRACSWASPPRLMCSKVSVV